MTPLRKKMIDDMVLRGLSERTQQRYVDAVAGLAKFYKRGPDTLGDEEVQRYLLHLRQERGLSASSTNVTLHALRFLFHKTLRREPRDSKNKWPKCGCARVLAEACGIGVVVERVRVRRGFLS